MDRVRARLSSRVRRAGPAAAGSDVTPLRPLSGDFGDTTVSRYTSESVFGSGPEGGMIEKILGRRTQGSRPGDPGAASRTRRLQATAAAGALVLLAALAVPASTWSSSRATAPAIHARAGSGARAEAVQASAEPVAT